LLLSAPKGTRRITTAGAVILFPKFQSEVVWEMLRSTIWFLHKRVSQTVFEVHGIEMDEENYLKALSIPAPDISKREPG
jgi:hypothetical protein